MAHPNRKEASEGHDAKLRRMTMDYGAASGPANNKLAPPNRLKAEGGEEAVGFGADSSNAKARGDRSKRRATPTVAVATYAKGGRVKKYDTGGDVSSIEEANRNQAMAARAKGGRIKHKAGTHVNVIVAPQGSASGNTPIPTPMTHPAAAMPPAMPPAPPPGAGMPPNPMMAGARPPMPMAPGAMPPGMMPPRKRGGRVDHDDASEDKTLIRKMVKGSALKASGGRVGTLADQGLVDSKKPVKFGVEGRARGGKIHMTAGADSGPGRLEKTEARRKNARSEHPQAV